METEDNNFSPTHAAVFNVIQTIFDTFIYDDIDVAYRVGRKGSGPRPILVKFVKEQTRNEVNRRRSNLKDSDETKTLFLNEDLPAKTNQQRAELRCIVEHAKSKKVHAKSMGNRISIDNKVYSHRDIDKLPQGLKISDAKTVDTVKGLAFQSEYAFLSNFYPAPIKYNGINFPTAEHAYQFTRATFLGKHDTSYDIRVAKRPQVAKREGAKLLSTREWDSTKVNTMREIVFSKFAQNPNLQPQLLATGDRPLLEATYDSFWGCGLPLSARQLRQGEWHGRNQLGLLLMECRAEICKERAAKGLSQISTTQSISSTSFPTTAQSQSQRHPSVKQSTNTNHRKSPVSSRIPDQSGNVSNLTQQQTMANMNQSMMYNHSGHNNQQMQMWPNQMMLPPPGFAFSNPMNPYFMCPPMPFMSVPNNQSGIPSPQFGSPTGNFMLPAKKNTSPISTASDLFNHGERRLSYDPTLSPVIHV